MINTRDFNKKWPQSGAYQKKLIDKNKVDKQGLSFAYLLFNEIGRASCRERV